MLARRAEHGPRACLHANRPHPSRWHARCMQASPVPTRRPNPGTRIAGHDSCYTAERIDRANSAPEPRHANCKARRLHGPRTPAPLARIMHGASSGTIRAWRPADRATAGTPLASMHAPCHVYRHAVRKPLIRGAFPHSRRLALALYRAIASRLAPSVRRCTGHSGTVRVGGAQGPGARRARRGAGGAARGSRVMHDPGRRTGAARGRATVVCRDARLGRRTRDRPTNGSS